MLQKEHSASQHQPAIALNRVCEHLPCCVFCAPFSKVCPQLSEKLKRVHKGAMLIQKLGIIKCGCDDLVDDLDDLVVWVWEC